MAKENIEVALNNYFGVFQGYDIYRKAELLISCDIGGLYLDSSCYSYGESES